MVKLLSLLMQKEDSNEKWCLKYLLLKFLICCVIEKKNEIIDLTRHLTQSYCMRKRNAILAVRKYVTLMFFQYCEPVSNKSLALILEKHILKGFLLPYQP